MFTAIYYLVYGQRYYLPFAAIMAVVIIHALTRTRR
jgi:hypothetical protein